MNDFREIDFIGESRNAKFTLYLLSEHANAEERPQSCIRKRCHKTTGMESIRLTNFYVC